MSGSGDGGGQVYKPAFRIDGIAEESERSLNRMNSQWCTEELVAFIVRAPTARPTGP